MNKRARKLRALAILASIALVFWVAGCWWWVGIASPKADFVGWCIGSMTECVSL